MEKRYVVMAETHSNGRVKCGYLNDEGIIEDAPTAYYTKEGCKKSIYKLSQQQNPKGEIACMIIEAYIV